MAALSAAKLAASLRGSSVSPTCSSRPRTASRAAARVSCKVSRNESTPLSLASVAAALGVAGAAQAESEMAVLADSTVASAVQVAEAAVELVAEVVQEGASNPALAEAVTEAAVALRQAETAVQAASSGSAAAAAAAVDEAASAMKMVAAQTAGGDGDLVAAVQAASSAIQQALEATGVDAAAVRSVAGAGAGAAQSAFTFLTTTDPAVLAEDALGLVAVAYFVPPLGKKILENIRGYAGEVIPTTALDALVSEGNNVLVDIRAAADKDAVGVPDLPDNTKVVELELATVADERLASRLRNAPEVEAEMTAVEIANLKKLNQGMTIYLLDNDGSISKAVAKELAKRGFGKVFVIIGGCVAWNQAKLSTRTWSSAATALLPSDAESKAAFDAEVMA